MQFFVKKINTKCDLCLEFSKIENKCNICNYSMCKECFDKYIDYGNNNCAQCRNELYINLEIDEIQENNKCKCNLNIYREKILNFFKINKFIFYVLFTLGFAVCLYFLGYSITGSHQNIYILNFFLGLIIFLCISIICGMIYNILCMG